MTIRYCIWILLGSIFVSFTAWSSNIDKDKSKPSNTVLICMSNLLKTADDTQTIAGLKKQCENKKVSPLQQRRLYEQQVADNPFAILPHKPNYLLPFTYSNVNTDIYDNVLGDNEYDPIEAKFQISIKYTAWENFIFDDIDLQFAFTATSWWQTYNEELSAPFRETNYEPEITFIYNRPWEFFGLPIDATYVSFNHQSNGQGGEFSRSWNRIIGGIIINDGPIIYSLKTWYRIPEDEKETPDGIGDDNPDIQEFLGIGELGALWQINDHHNVSILLRNNFESDNKGAVTLGWSYPLTDHLQGYVEYFNGYGESLIYYNEHTQTIGFGIKLTDWL